MMAAIFPTPVSVCSDSLGGMDIGDLTAQVEQISQIYAARFGITRDDDHHRFDVVAEIDRKWLVHRQARGPGGAAGTA